jgi:predicted GNAT family N-acyltransferase
MKVRVERATGALLEPCFEIRRRVFVEEQGVSRNEEFDDLDAECLHFLAWTGDDPVGTARMHVRPGEAKAQRVAVLAAARRFGVGRALMQAIEDEAQARALANVVLHAQVEAIPFYEAIGYAAEGAVFLEADIPHRVMRKDVRGKAAARR